MTGSFSELLDADGRCFELRRPRLRVHGINGQFVSRHLIGEMQCHESEARAQTRIKSHRGYNRPAPRHHPHHFPFLEAVASAILGREIECLAAAQRRA